MFDVVIIGGGPAGLSACVSAACEGLETLLIAEHIGGQAGTSSRIENYLGFPAGISGPALTDRACRQATKFGALMHKNEKVARIDDDFTVHLESGSRVHAKSLIIACGAQYRRPEWAIPYEGKGVHYACTAEVVRHGGHETVAVIGGGNSAGQAAVFLASKVKHVHLIVRGHALAETMSHYLWERILNQGNIEVHFETETKQIVPNSKGKVGAIEFECGKVLPVTDVYVMVGAEPNCHFLGDLCAVDERGFIKTNDRFETSKPGIYAVGDIRSGSIKRVANACGEGAACIQPLFHFLNPSE